jgi:hypothetical protein
MDYIESKVLYMQLHLRARYEAGTSYESEDLIETDHQTSDESMPMIPTEYAFARRKKLEELEKCETGSAGTKRAE